MGGFFATMPERCVRLWQGDTRALSEFEEYFGKSGMDAEMDSTNTLFLRGQITSAIYCGLDPINALECFCLAYFGVYHVYLPQWKAWMQETNDIWRAAVKSSSNEKKESSQSHKVQLEFDFLTGDIPF